MADTKALDRVDPLDIAAETRAEAALELLRSLAKAGEDPEQFAQACMDWSRLSDDVSALPDFQSVLAMLTSASTTEALTASMQDQANVHKADVFSLDVQGTVSSISIDVSELLNLKTGDPVQPVCSGQGQDETFADNSLIELTDRYGIVRQARIYPQIRDEATEGYLAHLILSRLSTEVRRHLRERFHLTESETEILALVVRRHTLEHVSEIRGIKLNTVRTHVARIINKLGCHSLTEAVSTVIELSNALTVHSAPLKLLSEVDENRVRHIALSQAGQSLEYRRYGASHGHPVIVLHSLEYGYVPSTAMIEAARAEGLNLIFPVRPGFGASTPAQTAKDTAAMLRDFIRVLHLQNVTLIGLSTAAPLALLVQDKNARIAKTLLVNYGLTVADKLDAIQPSWISGLLKMAIKPGASFAFVVRTLGSMMKTFGGLRFYRMIYRNQESDQAYLEANRAAFQTMANYLLKADSAHIQMDIKDAFLANPEIEPLLARARNVMVVNGANQHGVGPEQSEADAKRLGITFREAHYPGRNWMFQHPEALFRDIMPASTS